jgi:4-diphosphocytidyl-2-C-methyl-D-erythritol kinase
VNAGLYLPARAKLNLFLRIVGRRADGYHLLETLFHAIELHDDLTVAQAASGIELRVTADDGLQVPAGPDNLVAKALARLVSAAQTGSGFVAHLHKRIPPGAGLGGGSSDAAAALRLGNELLQRPLDERELARIAVELGADVPFFLRSGSQWGRGIGDELSPATVEPQHFVLLIPPFGCPTADVYKNYSALWKCSPPQDKVGDVIPNTRDSAVTVRSGNDLEQAAEVVQPALAGLRRRVVELGFPGVRMTGSGSALFVACADAVVAARCEQGLAVLRQAFVRIVRTRSAGALDSPSRRPPGRGDPGAPSDG